MSIERKNKVEHPKQVDIFGELVERDPKLRDRYEEPPFTIFDSRAGEWNRKRKKLRDWLLIESSSDDYGLSGTQEEGGIKYEGKRIGIQEKGHETQSGKLELGNSKSMKIASEAVFDPYLLCVLWDLFAFPGARIIDPFNGTHISGCTAKKFGYNFTGIDVRPKIIAQNYETAKKIFGNEDHGINWLCGDSNVVLDDLIFEQFDVFNSCPPYADLVKYSKDNQVEGDISLLKYDKFLEFYESIMFKCCNLLVSGGYAIITIGDVRDTKTGELYGLVPETVTIMKRCGMIYYNCAILVNSAGTAGMRAKNTFERGDKKLVPVHQHILIFKKP